MRKTQAHKTLKTREAQIYVVHPVCTMSTPNSQSFLSIIQQNEETKPTTDPPSDIFILNKRFIINTLFDA